MSDTPINNKSERDLIIQLVTKVDHMEESLKEIKDNLDKHYVTSQEFEPVKKIVYGIVGFVGIAVIAAIVKLVIA